MERAERGVLSGAARMAVALSAPLLLALAGCADRERAREIEPRLAQASVAINVSRTQDARQYAAAEMAIAEEKLAAARHAATAGQYKEANRLLAEALVNLELGRAKTEAERVKAEVARMQNPADEPGGSR